MKKALVIAGLAIAVSVFVIWVIERPESIERPPHVDYLAKLNALNQQDKDPNENAFIYYSRAIVLYRELPEQIEQYNRSWPEDVPEELRPVFDEWIEANGPALEEVYKAVQLPYFWIEYEHDGESLLEIELDHLKPMRSLAFLLVQRAKTRASAGDFQGMMDDIFVCYSMGPHLFGPKMLVEQLVGIAVQALSASAVLDITARIELPDDVLSEIQEKFTNFSKSHSSFDFTAERFTILNFIDKEYVVLRRGDYYLPPRKLWFRFSAFFLRIFGHEGAKIAHNTFTMSRSEALSLVDEIYGLIDEASDILLPKLSEVGEEIESLAEQHLFMSILIPAAEKAIVLNHRIQTDVKGLITTLAILRYQRDTGELPGDLAELVEAGYLEEVPFDPFSDGPFVYRVESDDFILYSFGEDLKDDGGAGGYSWKGDDRVFWPVYLIK